MNLLVIIYQKHHIKLEKNLRDLELEDIERTIQYGKDLLYSLQDISDSVVKMYDYRLQALDNYYSVEEEKNK